MTGTFIRAVLHVIHLAAGKTMNTRHGNLI